MSKSSNPWSPPDARNRWSVLSGDWVEGQIVPKSEDIALVVSLRNHAPALIAAAEHDLKANEAIAYWQQRAEDAEDATNRAEQRCKDLEAFVRDQTCECFDEYGHKLAVTCDRCRLLAKGGAS